MIRTFARPHKAPSSTLRGMLKFVTVTNARFHTLGTTAGWGFVVAGEKALPVVPSMPTGHHCPFLILWLNRLTSLSITQSLQLGC
jgi:hypothetical protein